MSLLHKLLIIMRGELPKTGFPQLKKFILTLCNNCMFKTPKIQKGVKLMYYHPPYFFPSVLWLGIIVETDWVTITKQPWSEWWITIPVADISSSCSCVPVDCVSVASIAESVNEDSVVLVLWLGAVNDDHKLLIAPRADVRAPPTKIQSSCLIID